MKTTFEYIDADRAIEKLKNLKKDNKKRKIIICTIDFENEIEIRKTASPDEGCVLVEKSKSIIYNNDTYFPHMELYSIIQKDISNVQASGIMHDIIWCHGWWRNYIINFVQFQQIQTNVR